MPAAALDCDAIEHLAAAYEQVIEEDGQALSDDPMEHLTSAAQAVFRSWISERARTYRTLQHLEDLQGTAVTVQAMVFGNTGGSSGAGVAFSRDPSTGAAKPVIDVLFDSQGEDVVSGTRATRPIQALAEVMPQVHAELEDMAARLEARYRDMQDIEFTVEDGKLWMLQTRDGKRTAQAAVRIAVELAGEKLITRQDAVQRISPAQVDFFLHPQLASAARARAAADGRLLGSVVSSEVVDLRKFVRIELDARDVSVTAHGATVDPERRASIVVALDPSTPVNRWEPFRFSIDLERIHLFDLATGRALV